MLNLFSILLLLHTKKASGSFRRWVRSCILTTQSNEWWSQSKKLRYRISKSQIGNRDCRKASSSSWWCFVIVILRGSSSASSSDPSSQENISTGQANFRNFVPRHAWEANVYISTKMSISRRIWSISPVLEIAPEQVKDYWPCSSCWVRVSWKAYSNSFQWTLFNEVISISGGKFYQDKRQYAQRHTCHVNLAKGSPEKCIMSDSQQTVTLDCNRYKIAAAVKRSVADSLHVNRQGHCS